MRPHVFAVCSLAVVVLLALMAWRHSSVQHNQSNLLTRARQAIGTHHNGILVCLRNQKQSANQIAQFIRHAIHSAQSPLRVSFAVVSDATATAHVEEHVHSFEDQIGFRIDLRTANASKSGVLACLAGWSQLTADEDVVVVMDEQRVKLSRNWDSLLANFITQRGSVRGSVRSSVRSQASDGPGKKMVFTAQSPGTYTVLTPGKDTCGWPTLSSRPLVTKPDTPLPALVAAPAMMAFLSTSFRLLSPPPADMIPKVAAMCTPLLLTDLFINQGFRMYVLPCPFFSAFSALHFASSPREVVECTADVWDPLDKAQMGKGLSPPAMKYVGLEGESFACASRALCGLTHADPASIPLEARCKYGSITQARAALRSPGKF